MRLLLDTQAFLWAVGAPEQLPTRVAGLVADRANDVFVSAVNTWELALKAGLGRVRLPFGDLAPMVLRSGFDELPVTIAHTLRVRELPRHHRDPFDRLLTLLWH